MKILVTGGCGFIGSNFIHLLLNDKNIKIINLDSISWPHTIFNHDQFKGSSQYRLMIGDISNKQIVQKAMKGCDAVVNFAAQSHVDKSIENPLHVVQNNVGGLVTLLSVALDYNIPRFLHISTDEVYGDVNSGAAKETSPLTPKNPYSASKVAAEAFASAWAATYDYKILMTRTSNNYGPWQLPDKAMPKFITQILQNKPITIHGTGDNIRDWIFVNDNCRAIFEVLKNGRLGEVYNVAGYNLISNIDLAKMIIKHLGKGSMIHIGDRPGNDLRYSIDDSKIKTELGWAPITSFEDGLKQTIDWYISNPNWWKKVLEEL